MPQNDPPAIPTYEQLHELWLDAIAEGIRDALIHSWRFREAVDALSDHDSTEARVK